MEKSKNALLFRKALFPWYDTEPALLLTLALGLAALLFSMVGIAAALDREEYHAYIWVPCTLGVLALIITVVSLVRLVRRGASRSA